jgi:chromosome partitioning protein
VLLVDLDPQGNSTVSLGYSRGDIFISIYEVLLEGMNPQSAVFPTVQENLFILPANENLPGAEVILVGRRDRTHLLAAALSVIRNDYNYIFIDCPPSLGILTLNGLVASDGILIPLQTEFLALEGLTQLLKTIDLVREQLNPDLVIAGVLLSMYDTRTRLTREVEDEVRSHFEGRTTVFRTVIPRNVRVAEAPSHGLPVTIYAKSSPAALAFRELAEEVINATETRFGKGLESPYPADRAGGSRAPRPDASGAGDLADGDTRLPDSSEPPPAEVRT